jgi:hypothetical protein
MPYLCVSTMSRRKFIKRGLGSAAVLYCAVELRALYAAPNAEPPRRLRSLRAFLDTLIPADSTPSASQLGLEELLLRHAEGIENYPRLLELGCVWLDETSLRLYGRHFDGLEPKQMVAVVTLAEGSPADIIARMFFERVRFDLMGLYYAAPASWQGLGISAPQPAGHLDFERPPRRPARG